MKIGIRRKLQQRGVMLFSMVLCRCLMDPVP